MLITYIKVRLVDSDMVHVVRETVHQNSRRIWGEFKLSDGSVTHFEMTKENLKNLGEGAWFQWGNTTDNLGVTVGRVEQLTNQWQRDKLGRLM